MARLKRKLLRAVRHFDGEARKVGFRESTVRTTAGIMIKDERDENAQEGAEFRRFENKKERVTKKNMNGGRYGEPIYIFIRDTLYLRKDT